jgi:uridine monophosphate synthetase
VHTEISVGSPTLDDDEDAIPLPADAAAAEASGYTRRSSGGGSSGDGGGGGGGGGSGSLEAEEMMLDEPNRELRKASVVSVTTTISARTEPISPQPTPMFAALTDLDADESDIHYILERLGETPYLRALLLLAEMSSEGNLLTGAYTERCVELAREHRDFVIGFVAQRSLNSEPDDNFLTLTPGVSLPSHVTPREREGKRRTDGLGQLYNSPRRAVYEQGADVVIVGRGIIKADDPGAEAERYRIEAWRAYEERTGLRKR